MVPALIGSYIQQLLLPTRVKEQMRHTCCIRHSNSSTAGSVVVYSSSSTAVYTDSKYIEISEKKVVPMHMATS